MGNLVGKRKMEIPSRSSWMAVAITGGPRGGLDVDMKGKRWAIDLLVCSAFEASRRTCQAHR